MLTRIDLIFFFFFIIIIFLILYFDNGLVRKFPLYIYFYLFYMGGSCFHDLGHMFDSFFSRFTQVIFLNWIFF